MKKLLPVLLGLTFVFQASVTSVVFISWKINRKRITELYCINKDNPMMHCEGKCYLSLQLKKIEQEYQHSKLPFNPKSVKQVQLLLFVEHVPLFTAVNPAVSAVSTTIPNAYINHYSFDFFTNLRKPPGIVSAFA